MSPRDFFGQPLVAGTFDGQPIRVALAGEFTALVLVRAGISPREN